MNEKRAKRMRSYAKLQAAVLNVKWEFVYKALKKGYRKHVARPGASSNQSVECTFDALENK